MDRTEIIEVPGDGVFRVKYHKLSTKGIRSMRSRLQTKTWKLRQKINLKMREVDHMKGELKEKESLIDSMNEDKIRSLVAIEEKRELEIVARANIFLKTLLGPERYADLQKKGSFSFKGLDGLRYRIKRNAELQQVSGKYWSVCCKLSFKSLPLPDFIASTFVATTHDPAFLRSTSRTRTKQEVNE